MRETIHDQVLADNIHVAKQMTTLIREMEVENLRDDRSTWARLQNVVHSIQLPNEGFVCIVDAEDGKLLCHPALGDGSNERDQMVKPVVTKSERLKSVETKPAEVSGSVREYYGELQIIAAAHLPELNASINVHQKASGIEKKISRLLSPLIPIGLSISVGLFVATTGVVLFIMRLYDNRLATINEGLERRVDERTKSLRRVRDSVIFGLAKLAESRDTDTGEHLERIGLYVSVLAAELAKGRPEINTRYIRNLALASSLHDIGKVGIPDAVLLKPGRFTPDERSIMETHAKLGGECIESISEQLGEDDFLELAREIAYGHHEKWDGTGYPFGVSGEAIPFSARIVAVADVYDALRSRRPYKEPMPHAKAKAIIEADSGTHFDPAIVRAFLNSEDKFLQISEKYNRATNANDRSDGAAKAVAMNLPICEPTPC
ncbi:MAG: HD domain-containing phosphohydrolase [Planctomycetota bacterium]